MFGTLKSKIITCAFVLIAALLLLSGLEVPVPGISPESVSPAKVTYYVSPGASTFAVSVHAPLDHLMSGDAVSAEILFTNSGTRSISLRESWMADCFHLSGLEQGGVLDVPAGSSRLQKIEIKPLCWSGAHPIALYFRPTGEPPYESVASIAPIQLSTEALHRIYRFFFLFSALLRMLAIPAALALFGVFLQIKADEIKRAQDRRDQKIKADQDARDAKLKAEQDERDRRESILRLRLGEYSTMVLDHYLPISRRMDTVESEMLPVLKEVTAGADEAQLKQKVSVEIAKLNDAEANDLWKLLCAILLYRAKLLELFSTKGGIYFRSNQAERLFRDLLNGFFGGVNAHLLKEDFRDGVELLKPSVTLPLALKQCMTGITNDGQDAAVTDQQKKLFERLYKALKAWVLADPAGFRAHTRLVQLSSRILDFECDRPFYQSDPVDPRHPSAGHDTGWYFDPPLLDFTPEIYGVPAALKKDLFEQIQFYIDHVPAKCKGPKFPPLP